MEKELINSSQIQNFLEDFETNAKIEILEQGKEQDEIFEIAQARGINLKDSPDLAGFKCIYCFADIANKNKARLPKKVLLKALPSLVGKPVDIDHLRNRVVGVLIDSRYIVKDEKVIAYGILFKANFPEDWETAEKKFKSGKLSVSYEIWCPQDKRTKNEDGTYSLEEQIIAGMAILDKKAPAFTGTKVLELVKETNISKELVFASYKCEDIIINGKTLPCQKCGKCAHIEVAEEIKKTEEIKKEEVPVIPAPIVIPKIKCANCQHEFDAPKVAISEMKCSECFAIINEKGDILYPPQIIDFNISCPSCSSRNWRLLKKDETSGEIKCLSCAKKYSIKFSKVEPNEVLNMIQFLHIGHIVCKQCGNYIEYSGTSQIPTYNLKCKKCGLEFVHDITKEQIKRLSKIEEIIDPAKASEEITSKADELTINNSAIKEEAKGEAKMEKSQVENIVEVASVPNAQSEVAEVKPVVAEAVAPVVAKEEELKVEETKLIEVAKVEETPKVEEKPAEVVAPIVEATIETPKVETPIEAPKVEVAKEETKEEKKTKKHKEWLRKMHKKVKEAKKHMDEKDEECASKVKFYKENAEEISKRRKELGDAVKNLSDEELLDNTKFSDAKLAQANLETSSIVGTKKTDEDTYKKYRDEITAKAEGKIQRTK